MNGTDGGATTPPQWTSEWIAEAAVEQHDTAVFVDIHRATTTTHAPVTSPLPPLPHRQRPDYDIEFARYLESYAAAIADFSNNRTSPTGGASESAIEKLERVEIGGSGWKHDDCCSICLEDMICGSTRAIRMDCTHEFHENCLLSWLNNSNSCPLCRFLVSD